MDISALLHPEVMAILVLGVLFIVTIYFFYQSLSNELRVRREMPINYNREKQKTLGIREHMSNSVQRYFSSVKSYTAVMDSYRMNHPVWVCIGIVWFLFFYNLSTREISVSLFNFLRAIGGELGPVIFKLLLSIPSFVFVISRGSLLQAFQPSTRGRAWENWLDEIWKAFVVAYIALLSNGLLILFFTFMGIEIRNTQNELISQLDIGYGFSLVHPLVGYVEQGIWFAALLLFYKLLRTKMKPMTSLVFAGVVASIFFGSLHVGWSEVAFWLTGCTSLVWVVFLTWYRSVNTIALSHVISNLIADLLWMLAQ